MKFETHGPKDELHKRFPVLYETPLAEAYAVAAIALTYLGRSYKITREWTATTIDCSTLVSQSHWVGAAVQTPFTAESQRLATNSITIPWDDLMPGDAVFGYPNVQAAPDGKHNHVALYLGADAAGVDYVVESVGGGGVRLTEFGNCRSEGGARRFCPHPETRFASGSWSELPGRVPKLGRLGARLTTGYALEERHRGTDIYLEVGASVAAPHDGVVVLRSASGSDVVLVGDEYVSVLAPIQPASGLYTGMSVGRGVVVGSLAGVRRLGCNTVPGWSWQGRLHWELWTSDRDMWMWSPAPTLTPPNALGSGNELRALNGIYEVKAGRVMSPALTRRDSAARLS